MTRVDRIVTDPNECDFYHVIDLPDGSQTAGQWDLRATAERYLGEVEFRGRRVLEIGPATGFLSFHMEREGAQVVCIEPPMDAFWDLVPWPDAAKVRQTFSPNIIRVRNSFWFLHHLYGSKVVCYEADAYRLPVELGRFDIGVFGSVLLHCRSPVQMLESAARLINQRVIVCERYYEELTPAPVCRLVPSTENRIRETWWEFSPMFFQRYLGVLGFPRSRVSRHRQWYAADQRWEEMFTVVAER